MFYLKSSFLNTFIVCSLFYCIFCNNILAVEGGRIFVHQKMAYMIFKIISLSLELYYRTEG